MRLDRGRVARLMKGNSARLRARRMRLLMTISASGPAPRSHSPLFLARSSSCTVSSQLRGLRCLDAVDLVPQLGGPLVILGRHGFLHLPPQAESVGCDSRSRADERLGVLPVCSDLAVDVQDQRLQLAAGNKCSRADSPDALAAKLIERDPADRTTLLIQRGQFFGRLPDRHLLGHLLHLLRQTGRHAAGLAAGGGQILPGMILAQMHFLRLPPVNSVMWNVAGFSHC